jgi:integrase
MRVYLERIGINNPQNFIPNTSPAITFRQQAERWLESMHTRRRKPVKPATIFGWRHALDKWLLPNIGDMPLSEVTNKTARKLVEKMASSGLSANTIRIYFNTVRMVVASAVNDEGDLVHPRVWNRDFIGLPIIQNERRPTITESELQTILLNAKSQYRVLIALLSGTGLRIGEALGLRVTDLSPDCRVLHVKQSVWRGKDQDPKTLNAIRVVDLPEVLAKVLREYVLSKSGYLFSTRQGKPLLTENVRRALRQAAGPKVGFHVFRRYRAAVLRKARVPEDLIKLWLGHARNLTDLYAAQLRDDVAYRQEWCERAGLSFNCDTCDTKMQSDSNNERAA